MKIITVIFAFRILLPLWFDNPFLINNISMLFIIMTFIISSSRMKRVEIYRNGFMKFSFLIIAFSTFKCFIVNDAFRGVMIEETLRLYTYFIVFFIFYQFMISEGISGLRRFIYITFMVLILTGIYQSIFDAQTSFKSGYGKEAFEIAVSSGSASHQNAFAAYICATGLFVISDLFKKNKLYLFILTFVVVTYLIFQTSSRGALLAWFIASFFLNKRLKILVLIIAILIVMIAYSYGLFTGLGVITKGNSSLLWRFNAWSIGLDDFNIQNYFIGETHQLFIDKLKKSNLFATNEVHNDYIRALYYFGFLGVLIYLKIISFTTYLFKNKQFVAIPLLGFLINSIVENLYRDASFVIIILVIIIIGLKENKTENYKPILVKDKL